MRRFLVGSVLVTSLSLHCGGKIAPLDVEPEPTFDAGRRSERDASPPPPDAQVRPDAGVLDGEPLDSLDLGEAPPGATLSFELPVGVAGFQIVVRTRLGGFDAGLGVTGLTAPDGADVIAAGLLAGTDKPVDVTYSGDATAVTIPQHDVPQAMQPAAGRWTLQLRSVLSTEVRILLRRTPDGQPRNGRLDAVFYIPDDLYLAGETLTVENAGTHAGLQGRLRAFDRQLGILFGVGLGDVQFAGIDGRFRNLDEYNFGEAALATRGEGKLMHVLLSEESEQFWGVAGGVPGAVGTPGTGESAFALASLSNYFPPDEEELLAAWEGDVLAHEAGHFLGLFHTTEFEGGEVDPLEDTPFCEATMLNDSPSSCPDYDNLMFPGGNDATYKTSLLQRRVILGSSLLREDPPLVAALRPALPRSGFSRRLLRVQGRELNRAERMLLVASCGNATHVGHGVSWTLAEREALQRRIDDTQLAPVFRNQAQRLLHGP